MGHPSVGDWAEPGELSVAQCAWVVGFNLQRDSWDLKVRALRESPTHAMRLHEWAPDVLVLFHVWATRP
jgi:hypothetical protein